ncbi:MAG: hypothetical protein JWO91_2268 [Acidobacteriaceae bacterium]|jgi:hypothetical protein|nr:hypothetical protein [Acidobacteriaceae bacterium]
MANRRVTLYKYIKIPPTTWRYYRAVFSTNNKLKPHCVLTPSGEQRHEEGQYYLGYRNVTGQVWEPIGND